MASIGSGNLHGNAFPMNGRFRQINGRFRPIHRSSVTQHHARSEKRKRPHARSGFVKTPSGFQAADDLGGQRSPVVERFGVPPQAQA